MGRTRCALVQRTRADNLLAKTDGLVVSATATMSGGGELFAIADVADGQCSDFDTPFTTAKPT